MENQGLDILEGLEMWEFQPPFRERERKLENLKMIAIYVDLLTCEQ
jgi:hypothetical protein